MGRGATKGAQRPRRARSPHPILRQGRTQSGMSVRLATAHDALGSGHPRAKECLVGKVVMYSSGSVDGFVADENDQPGPLFDWLSSGDVPLDESGEVKVSQTSYDYPKPYWDQIGATLVGRHVF